MKNVVSSNVFLSESTSAAIIAMNIPAKKVNTIYRIFTTKNIEKNLDRMLAKEKITEEEKQNTLSNITTYTDLNDGVKEADLVVEAATEIS